MAVVADRMEQVAAQGFLAAVVAAVAHLVLTLELEHLGVVGQFVLFGPVQSVHSHLLV
jgi:hypothetical protein